MQDETEDLRELITEEPTVESVRSALAAHGIAESQVVSVSPTDPFTFTGESVQMGSTLFRYVKPSRVRFRVVYRKGV